MRRFLSGLGALIALAAAVIGVPLLLIMMVGNPLPTGFDLPSFWRVLTRPDDGTVLIRIVAIIAWVAWLVFAISVAVELIAALTRYRVRIRLPGLAGPQKIAGGLLLLVITMFVAPQQLATADPAPDQPSHHTPTSVATTADPRPAARDSPAEQRTAGRNGETGGVTHVVQPGDELWTLAEHYYGKGQDWRLIAQANRGLLTGGPDRLQPGWRLHIPGVDPDQRRVVVRPGDTLSSIAEQEYGDPAAWHRIYRANRGVLSDPDLLPVGLSLTIPTDRSGTSPAHGADDGAPNHPAGDEPTTDRSLGDENAGGRGTPERPAAPDSGSSRTERRADPPTEPTSPETAVADRSAGTATVASPTADDTWGHAMRIAGVGGLMAAAVIGGLATRRQLQLHTREVGRRIPQPPPAAQRLEAELGRRQTPVGLDLLDLALRTIGAECYRNGRPLPRLQAAACNDDGLSLVMAEPGLPAPVGFLVDERRWRLAPADAEFLLRDRTAVDAAQPYPALTSLGTAPDGSVVLVNLESAGLFAVDRRDPAASRGMLTAMATELAFAPWADELVISVVGDDRDLAGSIDRYNVSSITDLDQLLDRWEQRARVQRDHLLADPERAAGDYRIDPDLADPWVPEVGLILTEPDAWQVERLERLLLTEPAITTAAVMIGETTAVDWRLIIEPTTRRAELSPLGWSFTPQLITEQLGGVLSELIRTTGSQETEPAPWWAADFDGSAHPPSRALVGPPSDNQPDVRTAERVLPRPVAAVAPLPPVAQPPTDESAVRTVDDQPDRDQPDHDQPDHDQPDVPEDHSGGLPGDHHADDRTEVADTWQIAAAASWPSIAVHPTGESLQEIVARSDAEWAWLTPVDRPRASKESAIVPNPFAAAAPQVPRHPTLLLLGPADLLGTTGERPNRAIMQCIEYCTWLLEHPGSTALAMAAGLAVAEGTRRSNMSRLRIWLGTDDRGEPYLPDAYSGKISLSPLVSSDWHRLQLLTHAGVNRTSTEGLANALDLVRGAPLADAAPGQWHWAEEMRTDMVSVIRDIGVELTDRALSETDIDLARWAASRALTAAPQDEFLIGARIRTEHQAGNAAEVERLALQLAAQGRALGVDLHPDTVDLLQQVMEGRLRARA
ncbi:LysM peptidoglycan-binding domain-containing protein [Microlunatus sp. Gsoil 973]|uniref:LysM peptidoglycan-binding domain-containing protein n=1 Tax=Microlunatus sp. Gsoil 973 TaxID=2672569 RepID=UPI0012B4CD60|nr:LysM peptidoglycan-binding domain-containing protein [Microlunatus sp. Gsoil 973]QGN34573.1 LysM peptidoglycan-binding domain-containing protein [Microlunatus sp. Gsoil 973]